MRKISTLFLSFLFAFNHAWAQSKVFKEVSKDMETDIKMIIQDNNLVGYLVFDKLEKVSADSFSYKLSFLDENLNDISSFSFKDQNLQIQSVAFDHEVLCIGYLRNNAPERIKGKFETEIKKVKSSVYVQFLNLSGKLLNEYSERVYATFSEYDFPLGSNIMGFNIPSNATSSAFKGHLRNAIEIVNVPEKGFALSYTESKFVNGTKIKKLTKSDPYFDAKSLQHFEFFDMNGKQAWGKILPDSKMYYSTALCNGSDLYLLRKNKEEGTNIEAGFEVLCVDVADGNIKKQKKLTDKDGNQLSVLSFANGISDNNPVISGLIISKHKKSELSSHLAKGKNKGVYEITMKDTSFNTQKSNWSEGTYKPSISRRGLVKDINAYPDIRYSFADATGNNYYVGTGVHRKTRWGAIGVAIVTAPIIIPPIWMLFPGIYKYKYRDEVMLKQDEKGHLSYYGSLKSNDSKSDLSLTKAYKEKRYFTVDQNKYLVVNDLKDIFIYEIATKSLHKKIPHKDGSIKTQIYKAKEGYIMLSEYNTRDHSRKLSIEAL